MFHIPGQAITCRKMFFAQNICKNSVIFPQNPAEKENALFLFDVCLYFNFWLYCPAHPLLLYSRLLVGALMQSFPLLCVRACARARMHTLCAAHPGAACQGQAVEVILWQGNMIVFLFFP